RVPAVEYTGPSSGGSAHSGRGDRVAVAHGIGVARPARSVRELAHDLQDLPPAGERRRLGGPAHPRAEAGVARWRDRLGRVGGFLDRACTSAWRVLAPGHRGIRRTTRSPGQSLLTTRSAGHGAG